MTNLMHYNSDVYPEYEQVNPCPHDEAPEQPRLLLDVDAIIQGTRAKMQQARLNADRLICQFAEAYVATAGQLREDAIQQYRGQLEGLPAELRARVCETLADDNRFCSDMDFGNGHMSYGGMSFTYRVESDAAYNALSHHVWKDCENHHSSLSGKAGERHHGVTTSFKHGLLTTSQISVSSAQSLCQRRACFAIGQQS